MPEEENKKKEPMVDIDTSGPEVEIDLEKDKKEDKSFENERETKLETQEPKEEIKVEEIKEETKKEETEEKKKELDDYSEGVQKRIAKLTKKWREAERQKEAALQYAKQVMADQQGLKTKLKTIEPNYVNAMEGRVTSGLQAAQSDGCDLGAMTSSKVLSLGSGALFSAAFFKLATLASSTLNLAIAF